MTAVAERVLAQAGPVLGSGPRRTRRLDEMTAWAAGGSGVLLLVDAAVRRGALVAAVVDALEEAIEEAIEEALGGGAAAVDVHVVSAPPCASDVDALGERLAALGGSPRLVGVGGGSVMDLAALLAVVHQQPAVRRALGSRQRSALVLLPARVGRPVPLALVPTTLGTGAEASSSACVRVGDVRRLVVGEALRPDLALVDPAATRTLPAELVREGVLEPLFRLVSMVVGDAVERPAQDALAHELCAALVRAGWRLARSGGGDVGGDGGVGDDLRLEVAELSARSHDPALVGGRDRYGARGWYVAHELSAVLGCRKTSAVARLLPGLWAAVRDGQRAWGAPERLHGVWDVVRRASAVELPADPAAGAAALVRAWGVEPARTPTADERDEVARRALRHWGAGLPMLRGLGADDVRDVLDRACAVPGRRGDDDRPSGEGRSGTRRVPLTAAPRDRRPPAAP